MKKWHKTTLVVLGAIVFSSVAIQASDIIRNIDGNLTGLAIESGSICGAGAVQVSLGSGVLCVDMYEASTEETCSIAVVTSQIDTQTNMNQTDCRAVSQSGVLPWRYVSLAQAQQLCGRSGKRLPTNDEWHSLVNTMSDQSGCIISSSGPTDEGGPQCATQSGIFNLIGNVWEWIDGEIVDGQYNNRSVPESGYVALVDSDGVVLETSNTAEAEFGDDYANTSQSGVKGILRGGFYGSGDDAGIYAQNLAVPLDLRTDGVGFRCVKNI